MWTVLCWHGEMEEEISEMAVKGRNVIGKLAKYYVGEECVREVTERPKKWHSPTNIDIWIRDIDRE